MSQRRTKIPDLRSTPSYLHNYQIRWNLVTMDTLVRNLSEQCSESEENDVVLFTKSYIEARAKAARDESHVDPEDDDVTLFTNEYIRFRARQTLRQSGPDPEPEPEPDPDPEAVIPESQTTEQSDSAQIPAIRHENLSKRPKFQRAPAKKSKRRRFHLRTPGYPVPGSPVRRWNMPQTPMRSYLHRNPYKDWDLFPKKTLNVDSPSFVPAGLSSSGGTTSSISSRAASATPFIPRDRAPASGTSTPNLHLEEPVAFNPAHSREFTPQSFDLSNPVTLNGAPLETSTPFDPFAIQNVPSTQFNPYLEDPASLAPAAANPYFQAPPTYTAPVQPLQHHLYAPRGPHREDLLPYQKPAHDFFMPEKLREEFQKKSEASLQIMPGAQLPTLEPYHSLVALDTNPHKSAAVFGYPTWVYKAMSSKNGKLYCLRRLEGYRLSNEMAIRSVKEWRRIDNGGIVNIIDAFTTRAFGDSSLIFVTDYHPLSKSLAETHFSSNHRYNSRGSPAVAESVLWGYIVQIASAIKAAHAANLAVRCLEPSKVLLTSKNRIRLNACAILDVVQFEAQRPIPDLQQEDLQHFGRLICALATTSIVPQQVSKAVIDQISHSYSPELRETVIWLLSPVQKPAVKTIDDFLHGISARVVGTLDSALHESDSLTSELSRELENGRLARLVMKLGTINERPEFEGDPNWSENGERYMLKLFRDYVFHQVDSNGSPVVDLAHIISSLNKLDVGTDEKIVLTSRDEQTVFIVSYKELKKQVNGAFTELTKPAKPGRGYN